MKIITSVCPRCHKFYTDEYPKDKVMAERYMFKNLIGVQCPQCQRWLLGSISEIKDK